MKKLLLILVMVGLIACLFVGCTPPISSEGEGEGEGEGEDTRVVLVELFTQPNCPYCEIVEPLIEQLADEYERSEVVFVEERAYDRYNWYLPSIADRSTPNILFNGFNTTHIHGSSSHYMIKGKINTELGKDTKISITATRNSDSTTTTISGTIKNISSSTLNNLVINGMNFKDLQNKK
jgi:thiol-disulfide isomerase/thioredoxin